MKTAYLAARYSRRDELRNMLPTFQNAGISITSNWLFEDGDLSGNLDRSSFTFNCQCADRDLQDIDRADMIIFFSEDPLQGIPRGARHVELGYALAKSKRIVVIGPRENVFHFLPTVEVWPNVSKFLFG